MFIFIGKLFLQLVYETLPSWAISFIKFLVSRLLTTGSIEEKIYQRQISKTFLSNAIIDIDQNAPHVRLSVEELKVRFLCYLR